MSTPFEPFELLGELPTGTTVLEASAGTGKTYAVGALVTRYVAEGVARLDEMLVITFGRAASQELRERVRAQLAEAERALADPAATLADPDADDLLRHLASADVEHRRSNVLEALADYDAATIATTHQFCHLVLRSLGVAGDSDSHATLVENLTELVDEVVDDRYLAEFASSPEEPPFSRKVAREIARAAVDDPQAVLARSDDAGTRARVDFAESVRREVERRKRHRGLLSYDDLLSRLADALEPEDSPARRRMSERWRVVLVDEFQDTDPVQWQVLDRAFSGHATMVLIGDPKQAIYAFRGGDVHSYLTARDSAGTIRTLATNWRSDAPLVTALQHLTRDIPLGDDRIRVHEVSAAEQHRTSRLQGAPVDDPIRLRQVLGDGFSRGKSGTVSITPLREHIAEDLAADVARLLGSGATYDGRPIAAGDVGLLMYSLKHVQLFRSALAARGIPSVITSGTNVLLSEAADHWLTLLEAMEQPARSGRVRAVGLSCFGGMTAQQLVESGEDLTDDLAERVRAWLDLFRAHGIAAVFESMVADGLGARVLATADGERLLTDLEHLAELLHGAARGQGLGLTALLGWLREERRAAETGAERTRRLDTDDAAVQILTIHGSKGLQYPVVYLPLAFDCWVNDRSATQLFHAADGTRMLEVSGADARALAAARREAAAEELRLAYVALTRAQSQVVAWWAPSYNAGNSGLSRLLFREPGSTVVEARVEPPLDDAAITSRLRRWAEAKALVLEPAEPAAAPVLTHVSTTTGLDVRRFDRTVDTDWRRTSYSGLIRAEEQLAGPAAQSEPEVEGTLDEDGTADDGLPTVAAVPATDALVSPMDELPAGAAFGSLVHGVLEHADPRAADLRAELLARVEEQLRWWPANVAPDVLADAMVPMHTTPLGPLAAGLTLADLGREDRLCELDFEFPMSGGDGGRDVAAPLLRGFAGVLRSHLADNDPLRPYADRLEADGLGDQVLRGYLSGSIDVVLRVPADGEDGDRRFLVVDYKTNRLGSPDRPLTAHDYRPEALAEAMLHSHYPLQALLYSVVLHRYLRWRLGARYSPRRHLGGVLYLYVRGMCGPESPQVEGVPSGVFSWQPPAAMVEELSALLDGGGRPR